MADLRVEVRDGIAVLTIDRAGHHNTIGGTLLGDLLRAAHEAERDDAVRAVVTTSTGPIWCASADFGDLEGHLGSSVDDLVASDDFCGEKGMPVLSPEARRFDRLGMGRWVTAFRELGKPLIAALTGSAAAGGLALALLHDLRIASSEARFRTGFLTWGVGPEMGLSWTLPQAVGHSFAAEMLLRDLKLDASEALDRGLVGQVVAPEDVLPTALEAAERLAAAPPLGVRATVRALRAAPANDLRQQLELEWDNQRVTVASEDARAAIANRGNLGAATYQGR